MSENPLYKAEIRLECLRLAYKVGQSPSETIAAAREYLGWVVPQAPVAPTTEVPRPADGPKAGSKRPAPG